MAITRAGKSRKFVFLVGDGMGDYPLEKLGGKTPLEAADTPHMDRIASCRLGLVATIPRGMEPGSDVANLSLLGYDPRIYHRGRAPLEAASLGVRLGPDQVAFRMNLVTLEFRSPDEIIMISHSAGDVSTEEAGPILRDLGAAYDLPGIEIHQGVAYRHLLVWDDGPEREKTIPPHDVLDQDMSPYLREAGSNPVPDMIRRSWDILRDHPVNRDRRRQGRKEANSIWLWGQGKAPRMPLFSDRYGLRGGVISAVDLLKGTGIYAGFRPIHVEGATGYLDTNYSGKVDAALTGLRDLDFVFLHVEAPDEAGHSGNTDEKIEAIERFDSRVVGPILEGLAPMEDYRVMVVSDHFTPIVKKTHTGDPTLFAWAGKAELEARPEGPPFTESAASRTGLFFTQGHELMSAFLA
ncbi:MAG: cofactor-independent phosphoglycerate mutase [Deltaproteobacteria bacterium]|nr:cofactor-independent phosphoglycerate mutase [Deltaproteobacteria bacterium]